MNNALLIFIKNVQKGKVKTRLAQTLGDDKALKIYQALLEHTHSVADTFVGNRMVFYSQFIEENDSWQVSKFQKYLQQGNDLGERMQYAFETAFEENDTVIIIGSDCASLTPEILQKAVEKLENHDFVLGPALDGGYYLLGMSTFQPLVFEEIKWSTSEVLSKTVQHIKDLNKTYALLEPLSDIDYAEDWEKWGWEI